MEVSSFSFDAAALRSKIAASSAKAVALEAVLAAQRSILCFLLLTGSMLQGIDGLPEITFSDKCFPLDELHKVEKSGPENKDGSDTDDDEEEEEDDDDQDDDDAGDEDFSAEDGDDDEDGDPEDDPAANGNGGSDEEDEEDGEDDEDGEEDGEEEEEDEEEDEDQPPAKKRK